MSTFTNSDNCSDSDSYRKSQYKIHVIYMIAVALLGFNSLANSKPHLRPNNWAQPIINSELQNFYQISDKLYRSEQPNGKAFKELASFGIKNVLNLRKHHTDNDEAKGTNIVLHHLKLSAKHLNQQQIIAALKVIKQAKGTVLLHCWHGSDRTGAIAAAYRMVFEDWSAQDAIDEFINGGYGYHQWAFPNLIVLLQELDVKKIKKELGLPPQK